ncbi:MAG: GNAT family N-acetyltransferase [Roseburia sp.]|nr:GNAT family N-acetyltransferase [Anaeroplasma bactoclasticum]MCM1195622.1 GNAT family N-acetyltransferase [Roseburia sp.]MCM1556633.1 GNAT family N-acetyltransferase [Anaeroplasma bactoclasticum]
MKFLDGYDFIEREILDLSIIEKNPGNEKEIPFYWYNILLKETKEIIGQISLRIGRNYHSYYNGNIGYYIEKQYRGHHYASIATQMLYPLSLAHHQKELLLSCAIDNLASSKIIKKLGGILLEAIQPPKDYFGYYAGMPKQLIYILKII